MHFSIVKVPVVTPHYYVKLATNAGFWITLLCVVILGYEPADRTVHPPPPELPRVGSFFSYRCLVFPKKCPQKKACAFRNY